MIPNVLLESTVRALALVLAVAAGLWLARARNARLQMAAWTLVLGGSILMPLLMRWHTVQIQAPARVVAAAPIMLRTTPASAPVAVSAPKPAIAVPSRLAIFSAVYLVVAAGLLLRLLVGLVLTSNLWRRAKPVEVPCDQSFDIRETPAIGAPSTFGSSILLPVEWRTWESAKLQAVLAHERSHVEWGDFYVLLAAHVYAAFFWFSPHSWWLRRRLVALAEAACDDAALEAIPDRPSYAQFLIGFASGAQPASEAVAMARFSTVGRRVERILSEAALPGKANWRQYTMLALCASALIAVTAGCSVSAQTNATPSPKTRSRGNSYAIVSGDSVTMSGSSADAERARSFRSQTQGPYIWFSEKGKEYLITDPSAVKRAQELFAPQEELGRKQAELGEEQAKLGAEQARLGSQQAGAAVKMPALDDELRSAREQMERAQKELSEKRLSALANSDRLMAKLEAELKAAKDREFTQSQLGDLQAKAAQIQAELSRDLASRQFDIQSSMAELQAHLGELQARTAEVQSHLGEQQARLGQQQARVGEKQAKMGEEQARLAAEAERALQRLLDESLKNGVARPAK